MAKAEKDARVAKIGLWKKDNGIAPWGIIENSRKNIKWILKKGYFSFTRHL